MLLTPNFVAGLDHFEASHDGPYGTIRLAWQRKGGAVFYSVTVPPNATATLTLPVAPSQAVYATGKPLATALPTIRLGKSTGQFRQYQLAAGTYQLAIRQVMH